jgi:hypothetical protein
MNHFYGGDGNRAACVMSVGAWAGANGALFGFRYPWMVKVGDMRYLTEHGRRRLQI